MRHGVLEMIQGIGHMARLVGQRMTVDEALRVVVGVAAKVLVERHRERPAHDQEVDDGFGPAAPALQDHPVDHARPFQSEAAAVGERSLPEALVVAGSVETGRREKLLDLVVAVGHLMLPPRDRLDVDVRVADEFGADLADRVLDVIRERLDGVPRHVRGRRPPALDRLLVEIRGAVCPESGLVADRIAHRRHAPARNRTAGIAALIGPLGRRLAVDADV